MQIEVVIENTCGSLESVIAVKLDLRPQINFISNFVLEGLADDLGALSCGKVDGLGPLLSNLKELLGGPVRRH